LTGTADSMLVKQAFQEAIDRIEWRAQLMSHVGQEVTLVFAHTLQLGRALGDPLLEKLIELPEPRFCAARIQFGLLEICGARGERAAHGCEVGRQQRHLRNSAAWQTNRYVAIAEPSRRGGEHFQGPVELARNEDSGRYSQCSACQQETEHGLAAVP